MRCLALRTGIKAAVLITVLLIIGVLSNHIIGSVVAAESHWGCNYRNTLCLSEPGLDAWTTNILLIKCHSVVYHILLIKYP
jgi:hypothetical protein